MFTYQLKILIRSLLKNKLHAVINIAGFALGISSFIFILMYVYQELSIDKFNQNSDRICKITLGENFYTMAPFASIIKDQIPEIEKIVRIDYHQGGGKSALIKAKKNNETKAVQVKDIIYADSTIFDVFSFSLVAGNIKTSLSEPNTIILTKSTAIKIFGADNPIGQTIEYIGSNEKPKLIYTVSAIIEDVPENSSVRFNGIVSFVTLKSIKPGGIDVDQDFGNWTYDTYVLLKKNSSIDEITKKTNEIWLNNVLKNRQIEPGSESAKNYTVGFVSLEEVPFFKNNKLKFIYLILLVGIIIIIVAIINFINLSIAKASKRAKEIGIRKVSGSSRKNLIRNFVFESIILTFIATLFAILIVVFLTPIFKEITGKALSVSHISNPENILIFISGILLIGLFSGIYPALYLSAFKPIEMLKNSKSGFNKNSFLSKTLIIFQYTVSVVLIIGTIVISRQVKYMRTESVGFDKSNIIACKSTKSITDQYEVFKQNLLKNPDILNVATSSGEWLSVQFHMSFTNEINGSEKSYSAMFADPDFVKTADMKITEGRDFSWDLETDKYNSVILNETAVKDFGLTNPIGFEIKLFNYKARVIGVVQDFHNESFQKEIKPLVLWYVPGQNYHMSIRISSNNRQETIKYIKQQWTALAPEIPFEFQFLDEKYNALYKDEDKFNLVISSFSLIAILIACFGLYGVVSISTENCIKEIGIRKVNGAKAFQLMKMLNWQFLRLVFIAFIVAIPIAWYAMHKWLENFAYKTGLSWWVFILAGLFLFGIALLTVSWKTWWAASSNPVEALRYE